GMRVTSGFFQLLGWQPAFGREFLPGEEVAGNDDVIVLSHALWRRRFASDPAVVGRPVRLSGRTYRVVGVLPPAFQHVGAACRSYGHGETVDVWWVLRVPTEEQPYLRFSHYYNVIGRLGPGVTPARADEDLRGVAARLEKRFPNSNADWTAHSMPLKD